MFPFGGEERDEMKVLIVEDDADMAILTKQFLEDRPGISAIIETHPANVVDRISAGEIDCVVSDYSMPDMNGLELLDEVRKVDPKTPFILYTGRGSEEIASEAITRGATEYLQKRADAEHFETLAQRITTAVQQVKQSEWRKRSVRRQNIAIILAFVSILIAITSIVIGVI